MASRILRLLFAVAIGVLLIAGGASRAMAHDFQPGVVAIEESTGGSYRYQFTKPVDSTGSPAAVQMRLPSGCSDKGEHFVCERGLRGELVFENMDERMLIILSFRSKGGKRDEYLVRGTFPRLSLEGSAPSSVTLWLRLGAEHILGGLDHIAFVIGLLLVVGFGLSRRLLWTITAFTLAHSLTLALSVLNILRLPSAPVEGCIALSVLLVAREGLDARETLVRRLPFVMAGVFGLVHGLGFAGSLQRMGLPEDALAPALIFFNLGVEVGQLVVVAAALLLAASLRRVVKRPERGRELACYALGSMAAYWFLVRVAQIAGV